MATRKECVEDTMVVLQLLAAEHPTFGIPREEFAEVLGAPVVATDAAPEKTEKEEKTIEKQEAVDAAVSPADVSANGAPVGR